MNDLVPDLAIVPRFLMSSALVMPMPVSIKVSVLASLSARMRISKSFADSSCEASVREAYRILSRASDALEMSSRRKISLLA